MGMSDPVPVEPPPSGPVARPGGGVQSVARALDVLEVLAAAAAPLGVSEVAEGTGLPQGTTHRLLRSLQQRGYVRHDASRKYAIGAAALRLGDAAQRSVGRGASPHLARIVALTGETANLAVLEGDFVVYVAQVPSPHALRMFAEVGRRFLPHSRAVGKVLLADLPREQAAEMLRRIGTPPRTERTLTTVEDVLVELTEVKRLGYAVDDGEEELGVRCVAVPVRDGRSAVAAVSVSGPAERFAGVSDADLARTLRTAADALAAEVLDPGR